jgi:hypothetical protein
MITTLQRAESGELAMNDLDKHAPAHNEHGAGRAVYSRPDARGSAQDAAEADGGGVFDEQRREAEELIAARQVVRETFVTLIPRPD